MTANLTSNFAWVLLFVAGLLEVVWSISMKASHGFTRHHFTIITLIAAALSFWLLGLALRQLPVGTAYAGPLLGGAFVARAVALHSQRVRAATERFAVVDDVIGAGPSVRATVNELSS